MLIVFVALIAGPIVAGRFLKNVPAIPMDLMQPTGQNNNDTTSVETGTGAGAAGTAVETATPAARLRF
jgi:1,3-beta-glucan synthase